VGAVVVAEDERTFFGCNVENASLGLTLCAERAALTSAVASGARKIRALVVVTDTVPPPMPCGACLQWLAEFGGQDLQVVSANLSGNVRRTALGALLREPFRR